MTKFYRFIPALIWMGVIFYFSSKQTTGIGGDSYWGRFIILKSLHLVEYAILYLFLFFGFNRPLPSTIVAYLFSISDEFHQSFIPGRTGKLSDTLFDLAGIIIGFLVTKLLIIPFIKKNKLFKSA